MYRLPRAVFGSGPTRSIPTCKRMFIILCVWYSSSICYTKQSAKAYNITSSFARYFRVSPLFTPSLPLPINGMSHHRQQSIYSKPFVFAVLPMLSGIIPTIDSRVYKKSSLVSARIPIDCLTRSVWGEIMYTPPKLTDVVTRNRQRKIPDSTLWTSLESDEEVLMTFET